MSTATKANSVTFNAPTWASRVWFGRVCHEQMVKLAVGHPYEIVGTTTHTSAHSDMVESVVHNERYIIKSRKHGLLSVSLTDNCGRERPVGEVVLK